ncbi:MAG: hypothetical protein AAF806_07675 [Bacteroidota bacterium]
MNRVRINMMFGGFLSSSAIPKMQKISSLAIKTRRKMETKDIKSIEFDGLMNWYKSQFSRIQDKRADNKGRLLSYALLSGLARFS